VDDIRKKRTISPGVMSEIPSQSKQSILSNGINRYELRQNLKTIHFTDTRSAPMSPSRRPGHRQSGARRGSTPPSRIRWSRLAVVSGLLKRLLREESWREFTTQRGNGLRRGAR
jgi:hypothetical protein